MQKMDSGERFWYAECDRCKCTGGEFWIAHASPYIVMGILRKHFEAEHELECAFCFLKFAGFKELAEHVNDAHVSETAREERLQREAWHPDDDRESENMLPAPGSGNRSNERSASSGRSGKGAPTVPFLKVEDVRKEPSRAKVLAVVTENVGYNDLIVKIAMEGKRFFYGLKITNPAYETLFNGLGADETKWVGQEFTVAQEWSELYEKNFIGVVDAPAKAERKSK